MTEDEAAIQEILQNLEAAWNSYDTARWTALFAEDATFIHIYGGQLDGRAAIEGSHRVIWETIYSDLGTIYKGSHTSFTLRSIRFVRSDVAVVFAKGAS
jgi:uncharacterized protein (TIGR02246 family)